MKKSIAIMLTILIAFVSCDEGENAPQKLGEIPEKIIATKPCPTLYSRIIELFPEFQNNKLNQQLLFSDTVQKNVILTRDTDVYLTFISEGAGLKNTFGWYVYDSAVPPQTTQDFEWHILFPNVSSNILTTGDRLKLREEKFKKGSVIGFFLIVNGWKGAVDYTMPTYFTDYSFNEGQYQQHILFKEKTCGDIVLAFEDLSLSKTNTDRDFNDIIFTVSDNNSNLENSSFEQRHLINW